MQDRSIFTAILETEKAWVEVNKKMERGGGLQWRGRGGELRVEREEREKAQKRELA